MASKLLTERSILSALKKSAVEGKPCTIKDDEGSTLIARPDGAGWWRLRYWLDSKENRLSLSTFPETGLRQARDKRDAARRLIGTGADPSKLRKAEKGRASPAACGPGTGRRRPARPAQAPLSMSPASGWPPSTKARSALATQSARASGLSKMLSPRWAGAQ